MRTIFHIGMGKTGSTAIQETLSAQRQMLLRTGVHYLGQWMGHVDPRFDGFEGFQSFLRQTPEQLRYSADMLIQHMQADPGTYLVSNEQYLENIDVLRGFFESVGHAASLQIVVYVRPPSKWLPSAYAQWGVAHKTKMGPVEPFAVTARRLVNQYSHVKRWREAFGDAVTVRQFEDGMDVVQDFASTLRLALTSDQTPRQTRLPEAELILRAAYNSPLPDMVLPDEFNRAFPKLYSHLPAPLSGKMNHLFDHSEIPAILAENADTICYLEREFGIDLSHEGPDHIPDRATIADAVLGHLVDIVCSQSQQIRALQERISALG